MARIVTFPRTLVFEIVLDEMPIYRSAGWRSGMISGRFEVTYCRHERDWHISDIVIEADNARCGSQAQSRWVSLNGDNEPDLYTHLLDRITEDYADDIEEKIALELAEAA